MLVLAAALAFFASVSFWQFFTLFHRLFFQGDSWLFEYSDTLIRLFPLRFWQDVFLSVMGLILIFGLLLGLLVGLVMYAGAGTFSAEEEQSLSVTFGSAWDEYCHRVHVPWL